MFRKVFDSNLEHDCLYSGIISSTVQSQNKINTLEFGKSIGSSFIFKDLFFF